MLTDFYNFFTFGLGSDCSMNWSLQIPSHLKRIDTLPCKISVLKIDLISTLIIHQLQFVRHELINRIIVSSDIGSDLVIYAAISRYHFWHILLVVIFSASCVYADIMCIIRCLQTESATCRRPVELPDFWPPTSPGLSTFHYKISGSECTTKSAGCEWFEAASVWCSELECNGALLTMALISGADVSISAFELQDDSFNFHRDIN